MSTKSRVIHFVTGGGSGATKVALDLACGHLRSGNYEPLLVLRRKKAPLPATMRAQIDAAGLRTAWVDSGWKFTTRRQLAAVIADFQPQVFAAHGNSEHIWGRQAALAAGVPVVLHVEHNCERYPFWRHASIRALAPRTSATVCVSEGVADHVRQLGFESARVEVIHNGVDASRYAAGAPPFAQRGQDIVMAARFARQKDHPTLIRAAKRLVDQGWSGRLLLCGDGKVSHRQACERLASSLGIADRVDFLGRVANVAELFHRCRVAVLSTHFEGLPLVLIEYMAAGCAAIASDAPGANDVIEPGVNGWRFPHRDEVALATVLTQILAGGPAIEAIVARGQADAPAKFSPERQLAHYEALFGELLSQ